MGEYKAPKGVIQVYTDGSYNQGNKTGGYGAVIFMEHNGVKKIKKLSSTHAYVDTTSQRMEVRAILAVVKRISPGYTIDIYSDSTYCVNMLNKFKSEPYIKPRANFMLWKQVFKEIKRHQRDHSRFNYSWVRAHAGNTFNEMADRLAFKGNMKVKKKVCDTHGEIPERKK